MASQSTTQPADEGLFEKLIFDALNDAAASENKVHQIIADGAETGEMNMTQAVLAMKEADTTMRLMLQIRMKLVDAWNELRNMQV